MNLLNKQRKENEPVVRHDNIKISIERLRDREVISFTAMQAPPHEGAGARSTEVYHLNEDDSYTVVAQLVPEFTKYIVQEWRSLKNESFALQREITGQGRKIDRLTDAISAGTTVQQHLKLNQVPHIELYNP